MEGCSMTDRETFNHYNPSPANHHKSYHVFLSGGVDIRKSLVDHLFQSLTTSGFDVFLGDEESGKGENIEVSIREAIRNSTVHIPLFSADYASSARCLDELSLIWTFKSTCTGMTIIPLFYDVEPSDVRYPDKKGPYVEAFQKHREEGRSEEEMEAWKKALHEVSLLSGWSLATTAGGYEGRLVKLVVMDLFKKLNFNSLFVAKHPEGLSDRMEEMARLLELNNHSRHVVGVGVWGMGGLGKTTLAKAVYNNIHSQFQASCFVSDVRASTEKQGLLKLQKQILQDLAKVDKSTLKKCSSVDQCKMQMENLLRSIKALIILDDVDEEEHLDALVGDAVNGYWFGPGSGIIITTRDSRVFLPRHADVILYEMRELDPNEGMKLFCWHAFLRADPAEGYEVITEKIVNACQGLPLSLEVVGAHLYGEKNDKIWSEALTNLVKIHKEVYRSLKISYNALLDEEKRMFLDIAYFFIDPLYFGPLKFHLTRYKRYDILEFYVKLWEALGCTAPRTCLRNLEGKSLVRIDYHSFHRGDSIFWMHDHLRDLARQIIEEESRSNPAERARFCGYKDLVSAMDQTQVMPKVEGLVLDFDQVKEDLHQTYYSTYPWELMQNLKFMFISNLCHEGQPIYLPPKLLFLGLRWCLFQEDESASKTQPISICLPKTIGQLRHLRFLDMSNTRTGHLLNELRELINLEELYLSHCNLMELPQWLGNLIKLKVVDVSYNGIRCFPANFHQLKSLAHIFAEGNSKLKKLLALPSSLIELHLESCIKIQKMSSFSNMKKLEVLDLSGCTSLKKLPSLDYMHSLKDLNLERCVKLQELSALPDSLSCLRLSRCQKLKQVSSISHLKNLEVLDVSGCTSLRELPLLDSMHSLKDLKLEGCVELQELPALPDNFSYLSVSGCHKLQEVSSFSQMKKLGVLDLYRCTSLTKLPSLASMSSLKHLDLNSCEQLQELPALPDSLTRLNLIGCQRLQEVSGISHLKNLHYLDVAWCKSLTKLPSLDSMHSVKDLRLESCVELQELTALPDSLTSLNLSKCQKLQEIFGLPDSLRCLNLSGCQKLQEVSSISYLKKMEVLDLSECTSLTKLPSLDSMHSLRRLRLERCVELQKLPALPNSLIFLSLMGCQKLQEVSVISHLKKLVTLDVSWCTSLTKLPSLDFMHSLTDLKLEHCVKLQELPALPDNFSYLNLSHCH